MNISRKTIATVVALLGAVITYFDKQFGLSIDPTAVIAGISSLLVYVLLEAKLDLATLKKQANKFGDPKFWLGLVSALLVVANESFELNLPVESLIAVLTLIMGILFKVEFNKS